MKKGDKVRCINQKGMSEHLKEGEWYYVVKVYYSYKRWHCQVNKNKDSEWGVICFTSRFETISDIRKKKLEKLSECRL